MVTNKLDSHPQTDTATAPRRGLLVVIFLCSGFLALTYQILWIRKLQLILGATSFAMSTVIAAFFLGLALGSHFLGKRADRMRNPVKVFGFLEIGIGLFALSFPLLLALLTNLYRAFYPSLEGNFFLLTGTRFVLLLILLAIPTTLMGGTLPLLTRYCVRETPSAGKWIATLYAFNTVGAFLGTLACGFILIRFVGVDTTNIIAGVLNVSLGVIAIGISRRTEMAPKEEPVDGGERAPATRYTPEGTFSVLVLFGASGFLAIAYEIAWTRLLSLILKNSTYTYTTILATFLLGIGLGSALISRFADRIRRLLFAYGILQCAIAVSSAVLIPVLLRTAPAGFENDTFLSRIGLIGLLMLLPCTLMGASLPLLIKVLVQDARAVGATVGRAYAINTVGSIFGSALCGFLFLPVLGLSVTLWGLAIANALAGIASALLDPRRRKAPLAILGFLSAGALVGCAVLLPVRLPHDATKSYLYSDAEEIVHIEEGLTNIVLVTKEPPDTTIIYTNNQKLGAYSHPGPLRTPNLQRIQGHLPMILHPGDPKMVLGICLGTGQTFSAPPCHPIDRIDCVDISETVVNVSRRYFGDANRRVLAKENEDRVKVIIEDGRNYVLLTPNRYDVLTQEPPPHDQAGVVNLYTQEFYELCRDRVNEDGLVSQWLPIYNTTVKESKGIIRTFLTVFPESTLWFNGPDLLLLGSPESPRYDLKKIEQRLHLPGVVEDLDRSYSHARGGELTRIENFLGLFLLGPEELKEFSRGGEIYTDNLPKLEYPEGEPLGNNQAVILNARAILPFLSSIEPFIRGRDLTFAEREKIGKAQRDFTLLLEAEATYNIANAALRRNDIAESTRLYEHCLELSPEYLLAHLNLGVSLLRTRTDRSVEAFSTAARLRPDYSQSFLNLVQASVLLDPPRPFPDLHELLDHRTENDVDLLGQAADLFTQHDRMDEASSVFQRLAELKPKKGDFHFKHGATLYQLGKLEEALVPFEAAGRLSPKDPAPWISQGIILVKLKRPAEARAMFEKALQIRPGEPTATRELARIRSLRQTDPD